MVCNYGNVLVVNDKGGRIVIMVVGMKQELIWWSRIGVCSEVEWSGRPRGLVYARALTP